MPPENTAVMTDDEEKALTQKVKDVCGPIVADVVEAQLEKLKKNGGTPAPLAGAFGGGELNTALRREPEKGLSAARAVIAFATAKSRGEGGLQAIKTAHAIAKSRWGEQDPATKAFEKALSATDESAGAALLAEEVSADVIEFLRPASVIRQLNPTMAPMDNGTLRLPKITGGATGGWIGENQNAPKSEQTVGSVTATAKKVAVLTPISNDLLRRKGPGVETMVRDDLVRSIAQITDTAFIRADGSSGQPKGLKYWATTSTPANATVNEANVIADLGVAILALANANVRFIRPGWILPYRAWWYLYSLTTTTGQFVFRDEMNKGTLLGYPFARATAAQIPTNLGGGTETEVYFADFADVVVAEATSMLLDASTEAAYYDGANVVAAFSQDQTVIRAILETDLVMRHDESVTVLTAVKWGA